MENLTYKWKLSETNFTKDKGKVFSCFACGGGSTMGYKLAGFDVIGCNEIDKRVNQVYVKNHNPKYNYLCDIREFVKMAQNNELPAELYNYNNLINNFAMKTLSNADAKQLERIYLHLKSTLDLSNDKTNNCVRHLKLIVKKLNA